MRERGITLREQNGELCFSDPKAALTPALRAELANRKTEVITFLRQAVQQVAPNGPPLVRRLANSSGQMSFAQEGLWLLEQIAPGNPAYNIAAALRLTGALNIAALEQSLAAIVRRHETLRCTFPTAAGKPAVRINQRTIEL